MFLNIIMIKYLGEKKSVSLWMKKEGISFYFLFSSLLKWWKMMFFWKKQVLSGILLWGQAEAREKGRQ